MTKEIHLGRARGETWVHTQREAPEGITFGRRGILINPQSLNLKDRKLTATHRDTCEARRVERGRHNFCSRPRVQGKRTYFICDMKTCGKGPWARLGFETLNMQ